MNNSKFIGYAAAIVSALLLGAVGVFVRNIAASSVTITFFRISLGLLFLLVYLILRNELRVLKNGRANLPMLLTGILLALTIICYTNAVKETTLAKAAFLLYLGPFLALGLTGIFLKERFTTWKLIIFIFALAGLTLILRLESSSGAYDIEGYYWGFGASICYALFIVFNRAIPQEVAVLNRCFYQFFFAMLVLLPFLDASYQDLTLTDLYWLLAVGFFQGFLATLLVVLAIKYLQAIEYGTISYIEPLIAALLGVWFYAENLSLAQAIGGGMVIAAGVLQIRATKQRALG